MVVQSTQSPTIEGSNPVAGIGKEILVTDTKTDRGREGETYADRQRGRERWRDIVSWRDICRDRERKRERESLKSCYTQSI